MVERQTLVRELEEKHANLERAEASRVCRLLGGVKSLLRPRLSAVSPYYGLDDNGMSFLRPDGQRAILRTMLKKKFCERLVQRLQTTRFVYPQQATHDNHTFCNEQNYGQLNLVLMTGFIYVGDLDEYLEDCEHGNAKGNGNESEAGAGRDNADATTALLWRLLDVPTQYATDERRARAMQALSDSSATPGPG